MSSNIVGSLQQGELLVTNIYRKKSVTSYSQHGVSKQIRTFQDSWPITNLLRETSHLVKQGHSFQRAVWNPICQIRLQVDNTQVNKVKQNIKQKKFKSLSNIQHYMHDKRIVHVNPEGQLNIVLRHAQINSFKLFHKQSKIQERKNLLLAIFRRNLRA